MSAPPGARACLTEDELLALATGALADDGAAETHLASCALCVALMAAAARATPLRAWDALVGATLGPYRLDAQLGAGGLGAVYRAWDPRLARAIAVKVLHDAGDDGRLVAEARAAAAIEHRAIVRIYDVGVTDGLAFVAMELVDGETVRSVLAGGALPPARVRELLATLIDGVAAAHARGVVHRDLKPENLILTRDGLRILDFGLARFVDGDAVDTTGPGGGTAGYMAPEQIRGGSVDARADLFAIGAIAYELATGRRAFPGPTAADRLTATLRDRPPVDGLGELAPIVLRCLAVEVDERFQTALDLAWALRTSVVRPAVAAPPRWSRRAIVLGGLSTLAAGIGGVVVGRRRITRPPPPPELRALTHRSGRVYAARFTHDGSRVVVCAAWDAEPLELSMLELSTGVAGTLDLTGAHLAALSARGELALTRGHRFVDHQSARGELVVRSLHGGEPRVVAADVQDAEFLPEPLTPASPAPGADPSPIRDGALAVVRPSPRGFRIELPIDTPLVDEPGWITHLRASPDGTHLAYLRHPGTNDDSGALVLLELATRTTRVLSDGWSSIAGLAWDPSGDRLWFTAARDGLAATIRRVDLRGRVVDVPGPTAARVRLHDVAADRRMLVNADVWRLRAMVGAADRSGSEISFVADLSADGHTVAIGDLDHLDHGAGTYLVPYHGGQRLRLGPGFPIAISPSGRLVAANFDRGKSPVVYATTDGSVRRLEAPGLITVGRWLDEESLIGLFDGQLWRIGFDRAPQVVAPTGGPLALDPARARCAFVDPGGALRVLDLATGAIRAIATGLTHVEVCGWLAAPDAIALRSTTIPIEIERVDPITGARAVHRVVEPPPLGLKAVDVFVLHADGERFAYSYGQELSQLYLLTPRA
ncbi:MAG: protein kinase [Kofleriaceae bacterium]|jgi:hypothetical protein|nr:protein kinase [Kofleriaceae bacterium]MBP9166370.1 protein kinase [Kofleriaceae bacterium]MBP9860442.1 protein kinase [Kofleriaceae bacterium]